MFVHPAEPEKIFLEQLCKYDKVALQQFVNQYSKPLYLFTLHLTEDTEIAVDIVNKTFREAVKKIHAYDPKECSIWIWLIRVMIPHLSISHTEILRRALQLMKASQ